MNPKIKSKAITYAFISALLYALYPPIAKVIVVNCPPAYLTAFLYLGTGIGTLIIVLLKPNRDMKRGKQLQKMIFPVCWRLFFSMF